MLSSRTAGIARASALAGVMLACALAAPTQARDGAVASSERSLLAVINDWRAHHGMARLRLDHRLLRAADAHTSDMARTGSFGHRSSDGTPFAQRVWRYTRARRIGEVLARSTHRHRPDEARRLLGAWLRSPSHRRVLATRGFRRIGLARARYEHDGGAVVLVTVDLSS